MKNVLATLALAATAALVPATASPIQASANETNRNAATPAVSQTLEAKAFRVTGRIIYNLHSVDLSKPLAPQAIQVATPEPNANFMIGVGLLGVAYLLQRRNSNNAARR